MTYTPAERAANLAKARAAKKAATEAQVEQIDKAAASVEHQIGRQAGMAKAADVLLTEEDLAAIREEATKLFFEERKAKARKQAIRQELAALRRQHGDAAVFGNHLDDIITIMVDFPDGFGDFKGDGQGLIINQRRIENGKPFTGPRHVVNSIMESMWRAQVADHNLSGKTRDEFYRRQRPVQMDKQGASFVQTEGVRIG